MPSENIKVTYTEKIYGDSDPNNNIYIDECPWKKITVPDWTNYTDDIDDSNNIKQEEAP